jgi:hypothetical protein
VPEATEVARIIKAATGSDCLEREVRVSHQLGGEFQPQFLLVTERRQTGVLLEGSS